MIRFIFSSIAMLILMAAFTVQATNIDEEQGHISKTTDGLSFSSPLVPAELPFIEYCKQQQIEVNWKEARENFYLGSEDDEVIFRGTVYGYLRINLGNLEKLGLAKLHQQYAELYKALNALSLTPPRKVSSSLSSSQSHSESTDDEEGQDDTTGVVITFPDQTVSKLRHRVH